MFSALVGNEPAKQQLKKLLGTGRVPNALLFAGPEGVGKKLFAFELARALVCTSCVDLEGCGECAVCIRVSDIAVPAAEKGDEYDRVFFGGHTDVGIIVPFKRNVRIGSIRALEREAQFRPFEAPARFFVINDADKMAAAAANALLKTLEEPAATTHIVLITSRPDSLLPTIRSRSQIIRFNTPAVSEAAGLLESAHGFSHGDAILAARIAGGRIGPAVAFDPEKFRSSREQLLEVVERTADRRDRAALLQISEQLNDARNKDDLELNLSILESIVHDVWLVAAGADEEKMANIDVRGRIAAIASGLPQSRPAAWLREIEEMRGNFAVNINRRIATDALFMKMAA